MAKKSFSKMTKKEKRSAIGGSASALARRKKAMKKDEVVVLAIRTTDVKTIQKLALQETGKKFSAKAIKAALKQAGA